MQTTIKQLFDKYSINQLQCSMLRVSQKEVCYLLAIDYSHDAPLRVIHERWYRDIHFKWSLPCIVPNNSTDDNVIYLFKM